MSLFDSRGENTASKTSETLDRTCFQTIKPWSTNGNLGSDVAIAYGIDTNLPVRMETWRAHGYHVQVMTGVAWGQYQDYLYGRFDGINHEDEAQTDRDGNKIGHGDDMYYMCPGTNYGKFLCVGVKRALDAGAEAIYLEEPEFWDRAGYSEGFKREWRNYYHDEWQAPDSSVDARWRAGKLKYYLYRRALQQVFNYIQAYNQQSGRHIQCYVPTHSLLNYAQWCIVSPESSLAQLKGCDGYIAQVWTGTSREPNRYRGDVRSHTFETAFLEYGAMQNLVRFTGRSVCYLNDPIEDNPNHDWSDYRRNWESTLTASLLQPDVYKFEVAPWPERVFGKSYPLSAPPGERKKIPQDYATELQTVFNALNDMKQSRVTWNSGTTGVGVLVSDSLMFQRGQPTPSDPWLGNIYGMAMPLVMHGVPVTPVQLENDTIPHYLDGFRILFLSYDGQKPLSPDVHSPLVDWVKRGGVLVFCDRDADPYLDVHEWWNSDGNNYNTPRQHLFKLLGLDDSTAPDKFCRIGKGGVIWLRERPVDFSTTPEGADRVITAAKIAAQNIGLPWREKGYLLLQRGPYVIAAGLDEPIAGDPYKLDGHFVNFFDPELRVHTNIFLVPGARKFLLNLDVVSGSGPQLLASACRATLTERNLHEMAFSVNGVGDTMANMLLKLAQPPTSITLDGKDLRDFSYSPEQKLLWIRFPNNAQPQNLAVFF